MVSGFESLPGSKIVCGNAVDVMKEIPDGSVRLVITSPYGQ